MLDLHPPKQVRAQSGHPDSITEVIRSELIEKFEVSEFTLAPPVIKATFPFRDMLRR